MNAAVFLVSIPFSIIILAVVSIISFIVIFFVGCWKIFTKAGYSGFWTILMIIPLVNVVIFLKLAFEEWPIFQYFEEQLTFALARQHYTIPENEILNRDLLFPKYHSRPAKKDGELSSGSSIAAAAPVNQPKAS